MSDKDDYSWYKAHRICPGCRQRAAAYGHVYCGECMYRKTETYHATKDRGVINTKNRERYQRYRDEGRCVRCGQPARPGLSHCQKCQDYQNRAHMKWRRERRVEKPEDECRLCTEKRVEGYAYCAEHLAQRRALIARNRPAHISQAHLWRKEYRRGGDRDDY